MIFRNFKVKILNSGGPAQAFEVTSNPMFIGRSMECHISFSGHGVSRKHLKVEFSEGKIYITDLESRNGTFVDESLIGTTVYEYKLGQRIALGNSSQEILISVEQGVPKLKKKSRNLKPQLDNTGAIPSDVVHEQELQRLMQGDHIVPPTNGHLHADDYYDIAPEDMEIEKFDKVKDSFFDNEDSMLDKSLPNKKMGPSEESIKSQKQDFTNHQKQMDLVKEELSLINEELRNAKAKLHQKLKVIELELETRKLSLESEFQKDKNEKERHLLELDKEITIRQSKLSLLDHKIDEARDAKRAKRIQLQEDLPEIPEISLNSDEEAS